MARWSLPIQRYVAAAKGDLNKAARAVALDAFSRIIVKTPVDTGRARGNWMISITGPPEDSPGVAMGPGRQEGGDSGANGAAAQAQSMARVSALGGYVLGMTISMRNTLPYIVKLENGWSDQAPNGMVKTTMAEIGAITSAAARRIRAGGGSL